jgi:hypothetical protein
VYAEPLVIGTTIIVVTEKDDVYGVSSSNGALLWERSLGTAPPLSLIHNIGASQNVTCGDIDPLGITGTPVYDPANNEVYVAAELETNGGNSVAHQLFSLNATTGSLDLNGVSLDPPGMVVVSEQQRAALALGNGRVYVAYGGLAGDCGPYHGWVVSVRENGSSFVQYQVPTTREGGIWATSGPAIDAAGHVYVAVGNGAAIDPNGPYDQSDSVIELDAALNFIGLFAPSSWAADNAVDADLGSTGPTLTNSGVFQIGKSGSAYLVKSNLLGINIGTQLASHSVCRAFGGTAQLGSDIFVPCTDGIRDVRVANDDFSVVTQHDFWDALWPRP